MVCGADGAGIDSVPVKTIRSRYGRELLIADTWPAETDLAIGLETGIRVAAGFPELYFHLSSRAAL
jgi:hypothetical protein